jgi:hypothetical protein
MWLAEAQSSCTDRPRRGMTLALARGGCEARVECRRQPCPRLRAADHGATRGVGRQNRCAPRRGRAGNGPTPALPGQRKPESVRATPLEQAFAEVSTTHAIPRQSERPSGPNAKRNHAARRGRRLGRGSTVRPFSIAIALLCARPAPACDLRQLSPTSSSLVMAVAKRRQLPLPGVDGRFVRYGGERLVAAMWLPLPLGSRRE